MPNALPDDLTLHAPEFPTGLTAVPDDWTVRAMPDTGRIFSVEYLVFVTLIDEAGNRLVDESGNPLGVMETVTIYPQILHALPDDLTLNAE